jgi:hypothetical protein
MRTKSTKRGMREDTMGRLDEGRDYFTGILLILVILLVGVVVKQLDVIDQLSTRALKVEAFIATPEPIKDTIKDNSEHTVSFDDD